MAELDQHRPTTSTFHRPTMEESVTKLKRLQRFTRQFSIFVHCEEEKLAKIPSETPPVKQEDENKEDRLFKNPGNLRAVKRKRNVPTAPSPKRTTIGAKRKMMGHQQSIREDPDSPSTEPEIEQEQPAEQKKEEKPEEAEESSK